MNNNRLIKFKITPIIINRIIRIRGDNTFRSLGFITSVISVKCLYKGILGIVIFVRRVLMGLIITAYGLESVLEKITCGSSNNSYVLSLSLSSMHSYSQSNPQKYRKSHEQYIITNSLCFIIFLF